MAEEMRGGGVHGRGACMTEGGCGEGCAWCGAYMAGGMHGRGHVWQGACVVGGSMHGSGVCMAHTSSPLADITRYGQ